MSTRSRRIRQSIIESSPPRTRKGVSPQRSPARNRKSSPTVRSRQKSPSRKSPSRKSTPKYPARKSPSRIVKEDRDVKETAVISTRRSGNIIKEPEVRLEDVSSKIDILRFTKSRRLEYSVADPSTTLPKTDLSNTDEIKNQDINGIDETAQLIDSLNSLRNRQLTEEITPRRSSRLKETVSNDVDIRRSFSVSVSKSASKSISKSIASYSDEEDSHELMSKEKSKSQSVNRKLATPLPSTTILGKNDRFEFAGRLGFILYILIPLTVFYILISCLKTCSYKSLRELLSYRTLNIWFNWEALVLVISNYLIQAIFLSIPILGTRHFDDKGRKYYFNTVFSLFITINMLFALHYYGVLKVDTLLNSYLQMAIVSYFGAILLALIMFLKTSKDENDLNPYGNSGYLIYDLLNGTKLHAHLNKINIKLFLARTSNVSVLIFTIIIMKQGFNLQDKEINLFSLNSLKNILNKVQLQPTILLYATMQMIYVLYFVIREKKIISTFYWNSEGLGYLQIVSSALYPYYFTTISKYVADNDLKLTPNALIAAIMMYVLGLIVMLISNNIKYEFRKNPLQPSLMHLDSMPTFHGKKLLVSNVWGIVRHPNYTGDIMIHAALAIPGIYSRQIIAALPALLTIVMLLHRCWRDHERCRRRYGAAWQRYCKRVPCVLIPKIF